MSFLLPFQMITVYPGSLAQNKKYPVNTHQHIAEQSSCQIIPGQVKSYGAIF